MNSLEIWLLALGVAIDCFTVTVTSGMILQKMQWKVFLKMAFFFGFFQSMMPLLGWLGASTFSESIKAYDHWIAFGLLAYLGIRMIKEHFNENETCCFDPTKLKVVFLLAIATSIDALAVGISFAFTGFEHISSLFLPLLIIGLTSFVLTLTGGAIGVYFGKRFNAGIELFGGIILISIGLKILIEHLLSEV